MKILVLSYFYPPDLSAGSFRAESIVKELSKDKDIEINIITTTPNRYDSYNTLSQAKNSQTKKIKIFRAETKFKSKSFFGQILNFATYAIYCLKISRKINFDVVFATSSRLLTATLGAFISKIFKKPLYLDIRDIFIDTIDSVYNKITSRILKIFLSPIESFTYRSANHINLVSRGFEKYFKEKKLSAKFSYFTNGIDKIFIKRKWSYNITDKKILLYVGNIGYGQALHKLIPRLSEKISKEWHIKIIGDGNLKKNLIESTQLRSNISIHKPQQREQLLDEYDKASVLLLNLENAAAFEKVLPSKIFEYAATQKPIIAGVNGFSAKFIKDNIENALVFNPCDDIQANNALKSIKLSSTQREKFINEFNRKNIVKSIAKSIVSTEENA